MLKKHPINTRQLFQQLGLQCRGDRAATGTASRPARSRTSATVNLSLRVYSTRAILIRWSSPSYRFSVGGSFRPGQSPWDVESSWATEHRGWSYGGVDFKVYNGFEIYCEHDKMRLSYRYVRNQSCKGGSTPCSVTPSLLAPSDTDRHPSEHSLATSLFGFLRF